MNAVDKWLNPDTPREVMAEIERATVDPLDVEIEGFVADDFATEKPYVFILMNHGNSEPALQGLKMKLKKQAERCKVKARDFDSMLKSVCVAHSDLMPRAVATTAMGKPCEFEGLDQFGIDVNQVNTLGYTCTMSGVGTSANFKGVEIPVTVCGHPILITKRYTNILSNVETVDISYYMDGKWQTIRQIPRADVASTQKIVPILASRGVNVTSESAKGMVTFLSTFDQLNRDIIPRAKTTDTIGWMPDGSFVPFDGDIEVDAMSSDPSLSSMSSALHKAGDPEVWLNAIKDLRKKADSIPIRVMLAASFASVLVEPLGRLPGWVHMTGKGTTGKTISLRMAATVWGKAEVSDGWMRNMNATRVGMEVLAGFAHNLPLCLNELQTIQNEKDFAERVYNICECSGRLRGSRNGGLQRSYSWRLMALSCGEQQIVTDADREGANSRVVEILVDHMLFGDPEKGEPQRFCSEVLDKSYGHAGPMFIAGFKSEDKATLTSEFVRITSALTAAGKAPKQADTGALILIADRLAEKYVFQDGVKLTAEDIMPYLKEQNEIDDNKKAFDALKSMVSENTNKFTMGEVEPRGQVWGKIENKGTVVNFDQRIFDSELKARGYDAKRFIAWCLDNKIVEDGHTASHRSVAKQKVFIKGGTRTWAYVFHMDVEPETRGAKLASEEVVLSELPF